MFRSILPALVVTITAVPLANSQAQELQPDQKLGVAFLEFVHASDMVGLSAFLATNPSFATPEKLGQALREAILARDEVLAKSLVSRAQTPEDAAKIVNLMDAQGRNALFHAVETNSPALVSFLLEKGADLSQKTLASNFEARISNQNPLQRAYSSDNPALLQVFLESGNVNLKKALFAQTSSNFGVNSLLPVALAARNRALVKATLAQNPELKSSYYVNGIWRGAAIGGDLENLKALMAAGVPLDAKPRDPLNETASSALLEAARADRIELATYLLANGADVNAVGGRNANEGGSETPLSEAIKTGNVALIDLLLAKGANVNPALQYAASPLALALGSDDFPLAQKLLSKGALLKPGTPSLFDATLKNDLELLSKSKEALAEENREGETVFHYAALFGTPAALEQIAKSGAKQTANKRGQTPIFWAVRAGNLPAVQWFLKNGANATTTDSFGQNLLHLAAFQGSSALVAALIEAKADPGAAIPNGPYNALAYGRGVTPLHRAAFYGNLPVVKALLAARADANAQTETKMTPLVFAAMSGQSEVVKTLLNSGVAAKSDAKNAPSVLISAARPFRFSSAWSHPLPRPFPTPDKAATVTVLLAAGANPRETDSQGNNALLAAIPRLYAGDSFGESSPGATSYAAIRSFWENEATGIARAKLLAALLKGGVEANARPTVDGNRVYGFSYSSFESPFGASALHLAVENLDVAGTRALLENGADAGLENGVGRTPLDLALRRAENSPQRVDAPFANGRSVGFSDGDKPVPLLLDGSARREIIALLRKHGGDKIGRGPFFQAVVWGASKWVRGAAVAQPALLQAVANYTEGDSAVTISPRTEQFGRSATVLALGAQPELARFFIEKGAAFVPAGGRNSDLLFGVSYRRDWKMLDLLLQKGIKWGANRPQEDTPLHVAAREADLTAVKELVKRGAPLAAKNKGGETALRVAILNQRNDIAKFLREIGAPE